MTRPVLVAMAASLFALATMGQEGCETETENRTNSGEIARLGDSLVLESLETGIRATPLRVIDPVPVGRFDRPRKARIVGIEIRLENGGDSTFTDSLSNAAHIVTASGRQADPALIGSGGECGDSFAHDLTLAPQDERVGCIPFEVPEGEEAAKLQLGLDSGFGPEVGEWELR